MTQPLQSLIGTGSKVWLDSVAPAEVARNREWGITGATSNPIIIADLVETGVVDDEIAHLLAEGYSADETAWRLTDLLVAQAQEVFRPVWESSRGDDGYVSFELDPLLEVPEIDDYAADLAGIKPAELERRAQRYVELGKRWSEGHDNRMIKVPNTPSGVAALEELAAAGVCVNVTLTFTAKQYIAARDALWRGAQRSAAPEQFKSVFSIFVSRVDVYAYEHLPELSPEAQGLVGITNAKSIWHLNEVFWASKHLPLKQEIVFASTGTKRPEDSPLKYVEALAGSGIQTNPPATNAKIQESGRTFDVTVDKLPPASILDEIRTHVDFDELENDLMSEGLKKFAEPQRRLLALIAQKRSSLLATSAH
jgi:transaldolase